MPCTGTGFAWGGLFSLQPAFSGLERLRKNSLFRNQASIGQKNDAQKRARTFQRRLSGHFVSLEEQAKATGASFSQPLSRPEGRLAARIGRPTTVGIGIMNFMKML